MTAVLVITTAALVIWLLTKPWAWALGAIASLFTTIGCVCTLRPLAAMGACVVFIVCAGVSEVLNHE